MDWFVGELVVDERIENGRHTTAMKRRWLSLSSLPAHDEK